MVKSLQKKLQHFFRRIISKPTRREWLLLSVVIFMVIIRTGLAYNDSVLLKGLKNNVLPVGDFGPTPYESHINNQNSHILDIGPH